MDRKSDPTTAMDPPTPRSDVEWALVSVGPASLSLLLLYYWDGAFRNEPDIVVDEALDEIRIAISLPDLRKNPHTQSIENFAAVSRAKVELATPVNGRRLSGPGCILAEGCVGRAAYRTVSRDQTLHWVVPNVLGLCASDAMNVLRLQGFHPHVTGGARMVTGQSPPAETVSPYIGPASHGTVQLVAC